MLRRILTLLSLIALIGAAYLWTEMPQLREQLHLPHSELTSFEVRYSPEQLAQRYQKQISEKGTAYEDPVLELYPHLLLEVKYVRANHSYEGKLLWSLWDGEVVLNTQNWSRTHGYDDCLMARSGSEEMRIIHTLAQRGGQLDRSALHELLKQDSAQIDEWLERCRKKHLVTQQGNYWKLHLQNPQFCTEPISQFSDSLVERPLGNATLISARYRASQIIELAKAAFGQDFAIKRAYEVFLPVYALTFKYGDGSRRVLRFNAYSNSLFP